LYLSEHNEWKGPFSAGLRCMITRLAGQASLVHGELHPKNVGILGELVEAGAEVPDGGV